MPWKSPVANLSNTRLTDISITLIWDQQALVNNSGLDFKKTFSFMFYGKLQLIFL